MGKTTAAEAEVKAGWTEGLPPQLATHARVDVEYVLNLIEAAKAAHQASFTGDEAVKDRMQWAVTGLLDHATGLLGEHVYGKAA